jgi:allophanate hydrolase subunit 2
LVIGGARVGTYGYLHVGGGIDGSVRMGSRATHISAGLGTAIAAGDALPMGKDKSQTTGNALPQEERFDGGQIRVVASMQTDLFEQDVRDRFNQTQFRRDPRANRMGVRIDSDEGGFFANDQLNILSEIIVPGDILITGDGTPYVLMCECGTTGGYPRIGTVIPCDLNKVAQAPAGASLSFSFVSHTEAQAAEHQASTERKMLTQRIYPLVRDPHTMRDLLRYQLVSGAISATADPFDKES